MPLLLLPRSLRSRPPWGWRATGERCPPTAGVFIGWRQRTLMSAVAIAPSPLRPPCGGWGRPLLTLPCRVYCGAPYTLVAPHPHRPSWSALNAVGGSAALRYALSALSGYRALHCACVLPSPHFSLPPHGGLASSASSGLSPLGRCRRFGSLAPALLVVSVLGSPMENACAWGSSLPTTARPHFHWTHPADTERRRMLDYTQLLRTPWLLGLARSARGRIPPRLPPPPLGARVLF